MAAVMTKRAAIAVAIIYGAFVLIAVAPMFYLFSSQEPESLLFELATAMYTLTVLPAAILAIWWRKVSATWMICVAIVSALALTLSEVARHRTSDGVADLVYSLAWWIFVASIPGWLGWLLYTAKER